MTEKDVIEVINGFGASLDPESTPVDAELKTLGVDSLDLYNVLVELESKTGRTVPDDEVEKLNTVRRLAHYFS